MEEERIDWNDPSIPVQFYALRREVIRLNLLIEQMAEAMGQNIATDKIDRPGSRARSRAWKEILERHRRALEPEAPAKK